MDVDSFSIPLEESKKIIVSLEAYLRSKDYVVQEFLKRDGLILQVKKGGGFKTALGLSRGVNVNFKLFDDYFTVSFSDEKWIDKAIVAAVSVLILWPVLITVAIGAYRQSQLPKKIMEYIHSEASKYYLTEKEIKSKDLPALEDTSL